MIVRTLLLITAAAAVITAAYGASTCEIKNVVVLMLENRSFDHMAGYFNRFNKEIRGLSGDETNHYNASDPNSPKVKVNDGAAYVDPDPDHSVPGTTLQIYGDSDPFNTKHLKPTMDGFVECAIQHHIPPTDVMSMFSPETIPVMATLAQEFAIFDEWHASVPGPTEVNRMYVHSATSYGATTNDANQMIKGYPQRPWYLNVAEAGKTWNIYMSEISSALMLSQLRSSENLERVQFFENFLDAAKKGELPNYTFIDPQYYPFLGVPANDQHPSHSVSEGEALIKRVYEALRASPQWENSVLIVTYDEHGGFFDGSPPPTEGIPNPDGRVGVPPQPLFNFTRLGVRIPTIMASPCIPKGTVYHEAKGPTPTSHFDHTSTLATFKKMWNITSFLTKRDAWAGTFEDVFSLSTPRTDCPMHLPTVERLDPEAANRQAVSPMNDFQMGMLTLAHALHGHAFDPNVDDVPATQLEAAMTVRSLVKMYLDEHKSQA